MINIGDRVYKKSRKPFENKKRVCIVRGVNSYIQTPKGKIDAVTLDGCDFPVEVRRLCTDIDGIEKMTQRDEK